MDRSPYAQQLELALALGNIAWWEMDCRTGSMRFQCHETDPPGYDEAPSVTHREHFTKLLHPDDQERANRAMSDHLAGIVPEYHVDYRIKSRNGAYRYYRDVGRVTLREDSGSPAVVTGVVIDITDLKPAEGDERFRTMFHGHSAIKLLIARETGAIIEANEAAAKFYGWSVDTLQSMHIHEINDLPAEIVREQMGAAAAIPNARFEFRHRLADGSSKDVEVYSNAVEIGGREYLYSIIHDISDRKRAERALKESEQRLRTLTESMADAVWVLDDESERFRYVSPSIARIGGYSAEEMMNQSVREGVTAESYAALRLLRKERVEEFENGHLPTYVDIVEQTHRDGSRVTVEVHGRFVRNADTGRLEVVGVSRDITKRRQAEEALQSALERLRHAEEVARFGHWEFSLDDRIMRASEGARLIYGVAESCLPLVTIQACALEDCRPRLNQALRDLIERNVPYTEDFEIRRVSDGEIVHVHSRAEYDPQTRRVFGVVQDVTERKQIEKDRERLIVELQQALEQVKTLKGIVPICAGCKKIRDDQGYWQQVEAYVSRRTDAQFSHGICPDCMGRLYPED